VSGAGTVYSVEQANALLPELRKRIERIREARQRLLRASRRITEKVASDGGGVAGTDWFEAQRVLRDEVVWLADRDIALRDPETGLLDFPGEREGEPIWLCWRLDEERVGWWHPIDSGFIARKPL
jgi:hypothetical protein